MTRTWLTWVIASGVVALLVGGAVDTVRSSESPASSTAKPAVTQPTTARETTFPMETTPETLHRCAPDQIAVAIDVLGGTATIAVRQARGEACHLAPLSVHLRMWDRVGERVRVPITEGSGIPPRVGGDFSPGFERLFWIDTTYFPNCGQKGPFLAVATVGQHVARRRLSGDEVGCLRGG